MESKVEMQWLQCTIPKPVWDDLNKRRKALNVAWKDIILPGTLAQLAKLEANPPAPKKQAPAKPKAGEKAKVEKPAAEAKESKDPPPPRHLPKA